MEIAPHLWSILAKNVKAESDQAFTSIYKFVEEKGHHRSAISKIQNVRDSEGGKMVL